MSPTWLRCSVESTPADLGPLLDEEVNHLPTKYRAPFVLCYLEGKTNGEAARLLGRPKGIGNGDPNRHGLLQRFRKGEESMTASLTETSLKAASFIDLQREIDTTRRVLERLPEDQFSWKPHQKSMNLARLAMHVATLLQWFLDTLEQDELDLASPPQIRVEPTSRDDLLRTFEQNAAAVTQAFARIDDAALSRTWTLRKGEQVLFRQSRAMVLRVWCLSHLIHHRAQLCVYLRLLNIPVPAVYFNSADEPAWVFA